MQAASGNNFVNTKKRGTKRMSLLTFSESLTSHRKPRLRWIRESGDNSTRKIPPPPSLPSCLELSLIDHSPFRYYSNKSYIDTALSIAKSIRHGCIRRRCFKFNALSIVVTRLCLKWRQSYCRLALSVVISSYNTHGREMEEIRNCRTSLTKREFEFSSLILQTEN